MGLIFGKISVETPKYELIQSTADYEIRKYEPSVVAEVTYDPTQFRGNRDGGFTVLAKYIGAIGEPQNIKSEKVAMTAPVITKSEKISMTAPVVTGGGGGEGKPVTMQFVLPSKYKKAEEAPKPADGSVSIREEGERKVAVVRFSGIATEGVVAQKVENLKKSLEKDGLREELDYDDDDVEKNERKSQELACMDEPYYLPFELVPSSSRHLSQCPSSPRKKTILV
ncbi:Heme-binding-like protein, chloroplastic, partial [Cucurbita argyrosperma subsp. sororia]